MGYGAPNTNCNYYERVEGPRVWVARTGDEACYRGTRIPYEPRIILGMFASNSGTEVGVVSNGELDGDDNSPVMVKAVQVGTAWAADIIIVLGRRGGGLECAAGVVVVVGRRGSGTGIMI